ncbi:MAG: DUF4065 domain-containing protein [Rhodobacteraceae bacterium]|nr:DUF4065 domain-containing protein [Paracoccaceae bacterium]
MLNSARDVALFLGPRFLDIWGDLGLHDLQRLVYLAQGWHIVSHDRPLFGDRIEVAPYGPRVDGVRRGFAADNGYLLLDTANFHPLPQATQTFLNSFVATYSIATPDAVRQQVARPDGAWSLAKAVGGIGCAIPERLFAATFRLMLLDHSEGIRRLKDDKTKDTLAGAQGENIVAFRLRN